MLSKLEIVSAGSSYTQTQKIIFEFNALVSSITYRNKLRSKQHRMLCMAEHIALHHCDNHLSQVND